MSDASSRTTTRDIERYYFEQFRKAYSLPAGVIDYGDKPDVLLRGERTIGIEITKFYLRPGNVPGNEQAQRPLRPAIVSDAHSLYLDKGGKGIELTVQFNAKNPISLSRKKKLPQELADLAKRIEGQRSGPVSPDEFRGMPEVSTVYLNAREYQDAKWRINQVYSVGLMSLEGLERIVREKESKSNEYKPCDVYWLLIIVDWIDPAQEQEIRIDDLSVASEVFEKVIIYKPNFEHVVEAKSS